MITTGQIQQLNNIFVAREAKLYHACQFVDFCSYVTAGGIPSRNLLQELNLPFTPFGTDERDHQNDVWDKVFLNLHDFGKTFAFGGAAVPNPFGPILFTMRPNTFSSANNVAICMRSAGATGFNREAEGIEIEQVESLFAYPIGPGSQKSIVKFASGLQEDFPDAHNPEVSCVIDGQMFPLLNVLKITVDPYVINGRSLVACVRDFIQERGVNIRVDERTPSAERLPLYNEFITLINNNRITSIETLLGGDISAGMRNWANSINNAVRYQVPRFANYLRSGTITPLTNI